MKTSRMIFGAAIAAAVVLAASTFSARAEGLMDDVMGPTMEPKKAEGEAKPAADAKKKKMEVPVVAPDMVNPDAAKNLDDKDLIDKLTGEEVINDKFKEAVKRMGESQKRLNEQDTGVETQETQERIIVHLKELIEEAKKQEQKSSSKPSEGKPKPGSEKSESKEKKPGEGDKPGGNMEGGSSAASSEAQRPGGADAAQNNGVDIKEKGLEWGGLPAVDREAISTGVNDQFLPAYKDQIKKYYEALAEIGKAAKDR